MDDKFTAGPWSRDKYGTLLDANGSHVLLRSVSIAAAGSRVAEAEANTDLISAAPDLLAALIDAVETIKAMSSMDLSCEPAEDVSDFEKIIAKATGAKP